MNTDQRIEALKERFVRKFKEEATDVFSSPGRIELLGNHTDHNNGKVLVSNNRFKYFSCRQQKR